MGTCGCGDYAGDYKFPGPEGVMYSVGVQPSCHYCQVPRTLVVYRHKADDDFLPMVDDLPIQPYIAGEVEGEFAWPIEEYVSGQENGE